MFMNRGWRSDNEYKMNGASSRAYFRGKDLMLLRAMACLALLLLPAAASALVGQAREAPELEPYVVMVLDRSGGQKAYCSASVIARNVVLTAAHCVADLQDLDDTRVYFRDGEGRKVLLEVAAVAIHPQYQADAARRRLVSIDLALVRLAKPLPAAFTPVEVSNSVPVGIGETFRIAGFGVASERDSTTGGVLRVGNVVARGPKSAIFMWAADPSGEGLGACTGDSGAPIFAAAQPILVAVTVRAKGDSAHYCGALTQAVLIAPQRPWMEATLRDWSMAENARP